MKKFIFVINNMHIGGTRSSLLNLLRLFPYDEAEVDLYLLSDHGEYIDMIDERVNRVKTTWVSNAVYAKPSEISVVQKIYRGIIRLLRKIIGEEKILTHVNRKIARKLSENNYDISIAFSEGEPVNVAAEISAQRKYAWIHNDYSNLTGVKAGFMSALEKLNNIFFVAEAAKMDFAKAYPCYENKLSIIRNTINFKDIENKANTKLVDVEYKNDVINIVSVGRISKQKAFNRIPEIASQLRKFKFHWYIIGDGDQRSFVEEAIDKYQVSDLVTLCGAKSNPYPYIKQADLLVVTSLYESQPMVILEALSLKTPVISTNFSSAMELLCDQKYGVLCTNSVDGIFLALRECLNKKVLLEMKEECRDFKYDNNAIVREVMKL